MPSPYRSGLSQPAGSDPLRRLAFVAAPDEAPSAGARDLTVVLDAAYTPGPGDPSDVLSVRACFAPVLERHDLFGEALVLVDRWAHAAGLPELLEVEGVTYWYRMREPMWHWLHERLLWCHALDALQVGGPGDLVSVPPGEDALVDVLRVLDRRVVVGSAPIDSTGAPMRRSAVARIRSVGRRAVRKLVSAAGASDPTERRGQSAMLEARLARLAALEGVRVLVLTLPSSYQRIGPTDDGARRDPNLGAVIERLIDDGLEPIVIGIGMRAKSGVEQAIIDEDDRLLPSFFVQARFGRPQDDGRAQAATDVVLRRLEGVAAVPLEVGRADLAPAMAEALRTSVARVVETDVHHLARVERLMTELRPSAVLLSQEGHRVPWLVAAARAGVPTFAVQHGILYPTHPGYADRPHPRLVLPTRTFVFGDAERRALLGGAYEPEAVVVSGSPRLDLVDRVGVEPDPAERDRVRRELGVADGDRMLVVSTVHTPFVRRSHLAHMIEVCLGGPLPGVHVVFKQHPGERDDGPYRSLLRGLAAAGGYDSPPTTVVKDIDLYRLLRSADAHLGLHSTVLTDAVVAGTCNLIAMVEARSDLLGYVTAGVAQPIHDVAELREAMKDPRPVKAGARRAFLDEHFRDGGASDRIAASVTAAVRGPGSIGLVSAP